MTEKKQAPKYVLRNPDGTVTLTLQYPINYGEERIEKLTFQRPKAKHMRGQKMKDLDFADIINLASKITGRFPQALDELDMVDLVEVSGVIEGFLESTAQGGKTV